MDSSRNLFWTTAEKKAWFFDGVVGTNTLTIVPELPDGADRASSWRVDNLLKTQLNLTERNILTVSLLSNNFHSGNDGLSRFEPQETTTTLDGHAYLATVKDQLYVSKGTLLEIGFAVNRFHDDEQPRGSLPYRVSPEGTSGNFFRSSNANARRFQWIANLTLPSAHWRGTHEIKFGTDLDRITFEQSAIRNPIFIVREDRTLSRLSTFVGGASFSRRNFESSVYGQDRWSISKRLLLESGLRAGFNNVTNRQNPTVVNNNLDSPKFLTFGGTEHRVLTGRVRFIGRK